MGIETNRQGKKERERERESCVEFCFNTGFEPGTLALCGRLCAVITQLPMYFITSDQH